MFASRMFWRPMLVYVGLALAVGGVLVSLVDEAIHNSSAEPSRAERADDGRAVETVDVVTERVRRIVWGTLGTSVVAFAVALAWLTRRQRAALLEVVDAADAMRGGDLRQAVESRTGDEIGACSAAFNAMSEDVAQRFATLLDRAGRLEEDGELLATVLGSMIEGVVALDDGRRILFANDAARGLLDFRTNDVVGRPLAELARHPKLQGTVGETLLDGGPRRVEFEMPRTQKIVALVASRLPGEPAPGVVIVLHDVTDLRRLEALRHEFVANVSHELKTPLTTIRAFAETLLDGALEDDGINRRFVEQIDEQADRLQLLIVDLLQLGRMESDEAEAVELEPVDVVEVVRACVADHEAVARAESIELELGSSMADADDTIVLADSSGLRTVLDNLVDNALQYTSAAGRVCVDVRSDGEHLAIEVRDTGIGIAEEHVPRLFERFYRVDKARSRAVGGTGLGLAIVKHLVQSFDGTIAVDSQPGLGTRFIVRLPRFTDL